MDLLNIFNEYADKDQAIERAAFEAAMLEKLKTDPFNMSDLLWQLYQCQRQLDFLRKAIVAFGEEFEDHLEYHSEKAAPRAKAKVAPKKRSKQIPRE